MEYIEISPLSFVSHLCLLFTFEYYYSKHVISTMSLHLEKEYVDADDTL